MKKTIKLIIVFDLLVFLFLLKLPVSYAASLPEGTYCGRGTYSKPSEIDLARCEDQKLPNCKATDIVKISVPCYIDNKGDCRAHYYWAGCYQQYDPMLGYQCKVEKNTNATLLCDQNDGGGGGGPSYEMTTCDEGKYLSCGSSAEATQQNKSFCGYKKTCNKYYFPSSYNFPECKISSEGNPLYTCRTNCSCCDIGTERTCTLGASYTNTVSLYVGGGDDPVDGVYNQMMKDTCYRDGVKRRNDVVSDNPSANAARIREFLDARRA